MALESEAGRPGEGLPEFRVYQGRRFVPRRLCEELPIFGYSRISLSGEEDIFFLCQDGEEISSVSDNCSITLKIREVENGFLMTESPGAGGKFFGDLWVLDEREIKKVTDRGSPLRFEGEIVLFPVLITAHGGGMILAEKKNVLPGSLEEEFLREFVKGLVSLPELQIKRDLPAVFVNSDEAWTQSQALSRDGIKLTPWVRLRKPRSFYVGRRKTVRG